MLGSGSVSQLVIHSSPLVEAASMTAFSAGVISFFCSGVLAARKARSTYARMAGGNWEALGAGVAAGVSATWRTPQLH